LADAAKQRQAADVAALRQTVASLRANSVARNTGEQPSFSPSRSANALSNREDEEVESVDHQRRELKRARAQELVLLEEGDVEVRAKRTAEVWLNMRTSMLHACGVCT